MRPVYDFINEYLQKEIYPFHMPGHKRNRAFLPPGILDMEITEIPGSDNLLAPEGIIRELEERTAVVFGADISFLGTNGSTGGLLGGLMAVNKPGAPVIIARNCHKSVYSALVLTGLRPVYIFPEMTDINIAGGISPENVRMALEMNPGAAAVVVTSPTYEGFISDIAAIVKISHTYGVPLIVDEAHGANLNFAPEFPESAVKLGADIVVQSLHKQLPMFSQTAVTHVNTKLMDAELVKKSLNLAQTTSPSYMFLAQIDYALNLLRENPDIIRDYVSLLSEYRFKFPREGGIRIFGEEYAGRSAIFAIDQTKLLLRSDYSNIAGSGLERLLAEDYGIQIEMSGLRHIIAMTTFADTREGFERLNKAVCRINENGDAVESTAKTRRLPIPPRPETAMTPREAFYQKSRRVKMTEAESMISAGFIIPYPPGSPLIAPGEIITGGMIDYIARCVEDGITVVGADWADIVV
ncbi:MAG: aminotransferase class I/II-fold pyridoxal phosphate-dependent enzyme [Defluviitaleaceae bacterium]|nr:aminotransferase class I/II-fold pyridoxal phosphate-dependent enzyme [Defluviitaleaceae bacterium]MCL2836000.1 aminotransferase class I/II-fold pyridoxal phosphate-dependent enzyme [Defluviitaleaceae bacterium]